MSFKYYSASLPTEQVLAFLFKTLECVVLAHLSSRRTPCQPTTLRCISNKPHPFQLQYLPVRVPRPADGAGGIELKPKSPPNPDDFSTKAEEKILLLNQKVMRILGNPLKGCEGRALPRCRTRLGGPSPTAGGGPLTRRDAGPPGTRTRPRRAEQR